MFDKLNRLRMKLKPHIVPAALVFSNLVGTTAELKQCNRRYHNFYLY